MTLADGHHLLEITAGPQASHALTGNSDVGVLAASENGGERTVDVDHADFAVERSLALKTLTFGSAGGKEESGQNRGETQ